MLILVLISIFLSHVVLAQDEHGRITNSTCDTDADCQVYTNARCNGFQTFCSCNPGFAHAQNTNSTRCEKLASKLNDDCSFNEQCQLTLGMDSICSNGKCICRPKSLYQETSLYCYFGGESNYSCSSTSDCGGGHCDFNFCKCRNLQILRKTDGKAHCFDVSRTNCEINEQCQYGEMGTNSFCDKGKCSCNEQFIKNNAYLCVKKIGGSCQKNDECQYNTCSVKKTCECPFKKIFIHNDCHDIRGWNETCTYNEQCSKEITHSHCDVTCKCNTNSIAQNGSCFEGIGESCVNNNDCLFNTCIQNKCACPSQKIIINNDCFDKRHLNDACMHNEQCAVMHSHCNDFCRCNDSFIAFNEFCYPVSDKIGSSCQIDLQCTESFENTECSSSNTCQCKSGYHKGETKCFSTSYYRTSCSVQENCQLLDANCIKNICECDQNKTFDSEAQKCYEPSNWVLTMTIIIVVAVLVIILVFVLNRRKQIKEFIQKRIPSRNTRL